MSLTPTLRVSGAWAHLHDAPLSVLEESLAVFDPKRFFNRAFREGRWDGKVRLYRGRQFPAGLTQHVVDFLHAHGQPARIVSLEDTAPLDLSRLDAQYLGPIGPAGGALWAHQVAAVQALLTCQRGVVKVPTGGGKTEIIAAVARYLWEERGWRSLIVVPRRGLCVQTRERLQGYYGDTPAVGQFGDGVHESGEIVVATAQTLAAFQLRTKRVHRRLVQIPPDPVIRALVRESEVLILDECLTGDAQVSTLEGECRLDDSTLAAKHVWAFDELSGMLRPCPVRRWLRQGHKEVLAVRLDDGREVQGTPRTPLWTPVGWVMLGELRVGDMVASAGAGVAHGSFVTSGDDPDTTFPGTGAAALVSTGQSVWRGSPWTALRARVGAGSFFTFPSNGRGGTCTDIGRSVPSCPGITDGDSLARFLGLSSVLFTEPCSGIVRFCIPTPGACSLGCPSRMGFASVPTPAGKPRCSRHLGYAAGTCVTVDSDEDRSSALPSACRFCARFTTLFDRGIGSPSHRHGSTGSMRGDARSGTWMTARTTLADNSPFTPRGTLDGVWSGSVRGSTPLATVPSGSIPTGDGTSWCDCCLLPHVGGDAITDDTHLPAWRTSFRRIVAIEYIGVRETFDLEVVGLHNFVANGVVVHNTHHASAVGWYQIALYSQAVRRYGLSGTPLKGEELADLRLIGATGPIAHDVAATRLIDLGLAAKPKIALVDSAAASGPPLAKEWVRKWNPRTRRIEAFPKPLPYPQAYTRAIVENAHHNRAVLRAVEWLVDRHRPTLVLCRKKAHWTILRGLLRDSGIDFHAVWGATETAARAEAKRQLQAHQTKCVLATSLPAWELVVVRRAGRVVQTPIGALVDSLLREGATSAATCGLETLSVGRDGAVRFRPVTAVHRHFSRGTHPIVRVASESRGLGVSVTANHSLVDAEAGRTRTPTPGARVSMVTHIDLPESPVTFDTASALRGGKHRLYGWFRSRPRHRYLQYRKRLLAHVACPQATPPAHVAKCEAYLRAMGTHRAATLCFLTLFDAGRIRRRKSRLVTDLVILRTHGAVLCAAFDVRVCGWRLRGSVPARFALDVDVAQFLGSFVAEGCVVTNPHQTVSVLSSTRTNPATRRMGAGRVVAASAIWRNASRTLRKLDVRWRGTDRQIRVYGRVFGTLLLNGFGVGYHAQNKRVPSVIFSAPRRVREAFLRGLYLGDGSSPRRRVGQTYVTTTSRVLAQGVNLLLRSLGEHRVSIGYSEPAGVRPRYDVRGPACTFLAPREIRASGRAYYDRPPYGDTHTVTVTHRDVVDARPQVVYDLSVAEVENFVAGVGLVCCHNTVWDEGENVPAIGAIVLAEGVRAPINALQRTGRGMRAKADGPNDVWIVDFLPTGHERLRMHGEVRARTYATEGYETVRVRRWPLLTAKVNPPDLLPFERWEAARAEVPPSARPSAPPRRFRPIKQPKSVGGRS